LTAIIAAFVGIASALLTIFLAPNLQHYFWTRQRQAERQLAIIDEMNKLIAEYLWECCRGYDDASSRNEPIDLDEQFLERFMPALLAAEAQGIALFSSSTRQVVNEISSLMHQGPTGKPWHDFLAAFYKARMSAFHALYQEVGIPAPPLAAYIQETFAPPLQRVLAPARACIGRIFSRKR